MRSGWMSAGSWKEPIRVIVVGVLCALMVEQPVLAAPPAAAMKKSTKNKAGQIGSEERALHVLNRFTFGPRPGDVAAVEAMGVKQWFERQLNPASIDDSAAEARLGMFPAMRMPQEELMARYPSPQMLRQMIAKDTPLPRGPVEHAIYADEMASYKAKREAKQGASGKGGQPVAGDTMQPEMAKGSSADAEKGMAGAAGNGMESSPEAATQEEQLYAGLDAVRIVNLPPEERMQRILAMSPEELIAFRKSLNRGDLAAMTEGLTPYQKEVLRALQGSERMIRAEVLESRMMRDLYTERQLEAVMTDFWLNHFNVYIQKNQNEPYLLPAYERDVIRPHALGRFEDLLVATARSPAMLMYLDNWQSVGPDSMAAQNGARAAERAKNPQVKQALKDRGLNENYARELMELHTLGVQCEVSADRPAAKLDASCGKGYTQQDVIAVAKVLSGWTIDRPYFGAAYRFDERRHEPGSKMVLGMKIKENGEAEGLEVLHRLATSPATAKFISTKLAVRFVSDTPPPALVERMAVSFVRSDGDIKTVLRTMFDSPEFWSPEVVRAKVKTPLEFVTSAVRASGAEVTNALPLVQVLQKLGMPLYGMQTPNGYSWKAEPWVNSGDLVDRMNFALVLSGDRIAGVQTDWTQMLAAPAGSEGTAVPAGDDSERAAAVKEERLERALLGQPVSERTRATVLAQFGNQTNQVQAEKRFLAGADGREVAAAVFPGKTLTRPPVDREAAGMAGLLLGSPEFQRR